MLLGRVLSDVALLRRQTPKSGDEFVSLKICVGRITEGQNDSFLLWNGHVAMCMYVSVFVNTLCCGDCCLARGCAVCVHCPCAIAIDALFV